MKTTALALTAALTAATVSIGSANAAVITWGSATAISSASDVSTNGTLVEAYNGLNSGSGNVTVNGVTFIGTQNLLDADAPGDLFEGTTGNAAYDTLLSTADFGGGDSTTIVIGDGDGDTTTTGAGLLVFGDQYEIQVWYVDDREVEGSRVMGFASSSSDTVVELNDQYVIGTFTADATTQTLFLDTVAPANGFGNTHITAYQIRLVPEPGSLALLGLGGLLIGSRRRRG